MLAVWRADEEIKEKDVRHSEIVCLCVCVCVSIHVCVCMYVGVLYVSCVYIFMCITWYCHIEHFFVEKDCHLDNQR